MRVGGKRKLTIPPELGYGDRGAGQVIPLGATLVFEIELLEVRPSLVTMGQAIFTGKGGCLACHTIEGISAGLVGPDLTRIGADAADRRSGVSARDYLTIREPEAFVAEGVERAIPGLMTAAITASLSEEEVAALVEFLLAQY